MKYSYAFGLMTLAFGSLATADDCLETCNDAKAKCQGAPNANQATCAAEYASCLGYNPYSPSYVEPTACSKTMASSMTMASTMTSTKTMEPKPTGDSCLETCNEAKNKCQTAPGANMSTCAAEYASCLGYNPYSPSYVEPTACSKTMAPKPTADTCVATCNEAKNKCQTAPGANMSTCAAEYASCLGYNPYSPSYVEPTACSKTMASSMTMAPSMSGTMTMAPKPTADTCVATCNEAKNKCLGAPDANRSSCAADYASCLGYNPYENTPYVEPTACSKGSAPTTTGMVPVVTAAADKVKPVVALLAMGAAALL